MQIKRAGPVAGTQIQQRMKSSLPHRMSNSRPEHMDDSSTFAGNHEG